MSDDIQIKVRYFPTSEPLRRYFASFVYAEVIVKNCSSVEDWIFPDWAFLHFIAEAKPDANASDGRKNGDCRFMIVGPRSRAERYKTGSTRHWGLTLHPRGWALLTRACADQYANRIVDGMTDDAFAGFRPLREILFTDEPDVEAELGRITKFCESLVPRAEPRADTIFKIYAHAADPDLESAAMLADRVGIGRRTLERLCKRAFGFSPKQVLRRHRFMRSLIHFTTDRTGRWIDAIDTQYHDQAQFVRDFREIMGVTPREFELQGKPIAGPLMQAKVRYLREIENRLRSEGSLSEFRLGY